jgi:hypothetical protein
MFLLFFYVLYSVDWKASLNFSLDKQIFDKVDSLHHGLADFLRGEFEKIPNRHLSDPQCKYDCMGVISCGDNNPKNTQNIAAAMLEIITVDLQSKFVDLLNDVPNGRIQQQVRDFSSRNALPHAITRVNDKNNSAYISKYKGLKFDILDSKTHSENLIFYVLSRDYKQYIESTMPIRAVILHLHTRFDMCGGCAYTLDWELQHNRGFKQQIIQYCEQANKKKHSNQTEPKNVEFAVLVSSRQDYLVWGPSRRSLPPPPFTSATGASAYQKTQSVSLSFQATSATILSASSVATDSFYDEYINTIDLNELHYGGKQSRWLYLHFWLRGLMILKSIIILVYSE